MIIGKLFHLRGMVSRLADLSVTGSIFKAAKDCLREVDSNLEFFNAQQAKLVEECKKVGVEVKTGVTFDALKNDLLALADDAGKVAIGVIETIQAEDKRDVTVQAIVNLTTDELDKQLSVQGSGSILNGIESLLSVK